MIKTNESAAAAPAAGAANVAQMPTRRLSFGQRMAGKEETPSQSKDADVWLNIGYATGNPEYPIITLPFGIPIDTQKPLDLRGSNVGFVTFTKRRNELLEEIQRAAADLKPGEDCIIGGEDNGLLLQLRRKAANNSEAIVDENFLPAFKIAG